MEGARACERLENEMTTSMTVTRSLVRIVYIRGFPLEKMGLFHYHNKSTSNIHASLKKEMSIYFVTSLVESKHHKKNNTPSSNNTRSNMPNGFPAFPQSRKLTSYVHYLSIF